MGTKYGNLMARYAEAQRLIHDNRSRLDRTVRDHGYMTHALSVATEALEVIKQYNEARVSIARIIVREEGYQSVAQMKAIIRDILDILDDYLTEDMGDPNV